MLRSLRKNKLCSHGLPASTLHNESVFYKALKRDLKRAESYVIIESPFMTEKRVRELMPILHKLNNCNVKVRINTRNPYHHDGQLRFQAFRCIKLLKRAKVKLRTYNDMRHRKLCIIDGEILWEGSLNILSQSCSKEVMRRTVSRQACQQMMKFTGLRNIFW